jgi:hypothetical protein
LLICLPTDLSLQLEFPASFKAALESASGQSLQGRPNGKSGHVRYATESGSKLMALAALRLAIAS